MDDFALFAGQGKLFVIDRQSKRTREVLSVPGEILDSPRPTRDDRQLYFTRGSSEADIRMAMLK